MIKMNFVKLLMLMALITLSLSSISPPPKKPQPQPLNLMRELNDEELCLVRIMDKGREVWKEKYQSEFPAFKKIYTQTANGVNYKIVSTMNNKDLEIKARCVPKTKVAEITDVIFK